MAQSNKFRRGEAPSPHKSSIFRPSVFERPVLRIRYLTPEGKAEQASVHSTWYPKHADPEQVRRTIAESYSAFYTSIGCTLTHIEFITHAITEITPCP